MQHLDSITTSKDVKRVLVYKCEEPTASVIMGDESIAASFIRVDSVTLMIGGAGSYHAM
jgi:hypothetical protein